MKNTIKLFIGLLALTASVFAGNYQKPSFQFPEDSLHRKVQKGELITSEELTAGDMGELEEWRTYFEPGVININVDGGKNTQDPDKKFTETGRALTLLEVARNTFLTSFRRATYQSLLNIIRFQVQNLEINIADLFLTIINYDTATHTRSTLHVLIAADQFASDRQQTTPYSLQDFINFWYSLGLRLDTVIINGYTVDDYTGIYFDIDVQARVRAAFQEAERLAQANAPIEAEIILAAQPEGEPTGAQTLQQRLNPAAAQQMIEEQARTDAFRLGPSVFNIICRQ